LDKKVVNIVWFKRDFRIIDNEALFNAYQSEIPLLLICFFEPTIMNYADSDARHWRFIYQSIEDLNKKLEPSNSKIYFFHNAVITVLSELIKTYTIKTVYSHQEIGNKITYNRDIEMKDFFQKNAIVWKEFQMHGVIRKLKSRQDWDKRWENVMRDTPKILNESDIITIQLDPEFYDSIKGDSLPAEISTPNKNFQHGGEYWAWRYLDSFVKER
jgi:deoxyribodipyrimidine photo-lyase